MSVELSQYFLVFLEVMSGLFLLFLGSGIMAIIIMYVIDVTQTKHAIRRNYPVVGRFRYIFEHLGEFFRQYFFAMDREELPFNRAERSWVYRAAKNVDNTVAFGTTRNLHATGTVYFVNTPFPTLEEDATPTRAVTIGPNCLHPYTTEALFNISAMSFGALSVPAIRALSRGAAQVGSWLNTGEGGLSKYHLEGGADIVFQIGTAKYGVRNSSGGLSDDKLRKLSSHKSVKMIELKLSQGAKPGKGGILPGNKVTDEIAEIRGIPAGHDSISPNRHPEIASADDLLDMLHHIRSVSGLPVGFKAVLGGYNWLDTLMQRIIDRGIDKAPDFITVDSAEGGTGAAPMALMDNVGLPLNESLPMLVDKLLEYGLKDRIRVIASGKLITPVEVAWALCLGADFINSARGNMFALGCIQAMQCNKNTCPTGITTHDPDLQKGLVVEDKAVRVANYIRNITHDVGMIAHSCGVGEPRELKREHARVVISNGSSMSLEDRYPYPVVERSNSAV
ncbi:MAG: FMN-binding glutamate synthase family protein [marine bacterium B5-7]|nr:MAG: FMN-binding glutamate synthase family protein [marine bacterium B5-7]